MFQHISSTAGGHFRAYKRIYENDIMYAEIDIEIKIIDRKFGPETVLFQKPKYCSY